MDPLVGRWGSVREGSPRGQCGEMEADGQLVSRQFSMELQDQVGLQFPGGLAWST